MLETFDAFPVANSNCINARAGCCLSVKLVMGRLILILICGQVSISLEKRDSDVVTSEEIQKIQIKSNYLRNFI